MLKDSTGAKPVQKWATMGEGVFARGRGVFARGGGGLPDAHINYPNFNPRFTLPSKSPPG